MPKQYTYTGPVIKPFTKLRSYDRDIVPSIWTQEQIQKWLAIEPRYKEYFTEVEDTSGDNAGKNSQNNKGK